MEVFEALGEPVRRRVLEHLSRAGELSAGTLVSLVQDDFPISQPAVSQHLRVLREADLVVVRQDGARRLYRLGSERLLEAERWLADVRAFWSQRLDALETELVRGRRRAPARDGHGIPPTGAAAAAPDPDERRRMA